MTKHLEKLNSDCNMTAGLEAKLLLAVGARVMLRRNIDTKAGLVNGALGSVLSIALHHVTVQISKPYNIEKVKSRFMVMKNFYIHRKQVPLILAYDVDRTLPDNILQMSMHLVHGYNHFEVACSVRKSI